MSRPVEEAGTSRQKSGLGDDDITVTHTPFHFFASATQTFQTRARDTGPDDKRPPGEPAGTI